MHSKSPGFVVSMKNVALLMAKIAPNTDAVNVLSSVSRGDIICFILDGWV
jgi:hypothetical protein